MNKTLLLMFCIAFMLLLVARLDMLSAQAFSLPPTFTVNSTGDVPADPIDTDYTVCRTSTGNSICTLRAAIQKANHYPEGGVTILVPALTSPGEYGLTGSMLTITRTMDIIGGGARNTIIDGSAMTGINQTGILEIKAGTVIISGVTLQGAYAYAEGGGMYQWSNTNLVLDSVLLRNNTAQGRGGAFPRMGIWTSSIARLCLTRRKPTGAGASWRSFHQRCGSRTAPSATTGPHRTVEAFTSTRTPASLARAARSIFSM